VDIIGLRVSTRTFRDFPLFRVSTAVKVVPLPGVPLQQIRLVAILISSEGKLLHSLRFDVTLILCLRFRNELLKYYFFRFVFVSYVFCLLFVFVCNTVAVNHMTVDSAQYYYYYYCRRHRLLSQAFSSWHFS